MNRRMAYFIRQAQAEKRWAKRTVKDIEWKKRSSDMSKLMLKERLETPIEQLAKKEYEYTKYRAHARQGEYDIDPVAKQLWKKIGGEQMKRHYKPKRYIHHKGRTYKLVGKTTRYRDVKRHAKKPGKRKSSGGRTYYEYRRNRADTGRWL